MTAPTAALDEAMMRRALQLARNGELHASPNPMVGAVIADADGRILGEGWHRRCGDAHAEVNAVRMAESAGVTPGQLRRATIYVTLEPCSHYGKTPPCAAMLVDKGIGRVVAAMTDPNPLVAGRGLQMLRDAGAEVVTGVLEQEARHLNAKFITAQTLRRPFITLKWAQSADGFLDGRLRPDDPPALISSPVTKALVHRERAIHDGILVGRGTYEADAPSLATTRYPGPSPRRFLLSGSLAAAPEGWTLVGEVSEEAMRKLMSEHGVTSLLVEGGRRTLDAFLRQDLFDAIRVETNPALRLATMPHCTAAPLQPVCTDRAKYLLHNIPINLPTL